MTELLGQDDAYFKAYKEALQESKRMMQRVQKLYPNLMSVTVMPVIEESFDTAIKLLDKPNG